MPRPSHSSRFYHPHNSGRGVNTIKLLIINLPSLPCYLIPLRPKYSPQHPIPKNCKPKSSLNISDQVPHPYKTTGKIIVLYNLFFKFLDRNLEVPNTNTLRHLFPLTTLIRISWRCLTHLLCWVLRNAHLPIVFPPAKATDSRPLFAYLFPLCFDAVENYELWGKLLMEQRKMFRSVGMETQTRLTWK
jgi:hypothetical protein